MLINDSRLTLKATNILMVPLLLSLFPAALTNELFRSRFAGLPIAYIIMFIIVFYVVLTTRASGLRINIYIWLLFTLSLWTLLPIYTTFDPVGHVIASLLLFTNLYLFLLCINIGQIACLKNTNKLYYKIIFFITICILMYFLIDKEFADIGFPNLVPFFFYRGAQGFFLISLFAIVCLEFTRNNYNNFVIITFVLISISIFLLESRTTYVAYISILFISFFKKLPKLFLLLFLFGLIFTPILVFTPSLYERILSLSDVARLLTINLEAAKEDGKSLYRIIYWTGSLEIIRDNWATGAGFSIVDIRDRFPAYLTGYKSEISRPHNTYLSMTMGYGIFGSLTYFLSIYGIPIWRARKIRLGRSVFYGYLVATAIMMMGVDLETNPQFSAIFGFVVGYIMYSHRRELAPIQQKRV